MSEYAIASKITAEILMKNAHLIKPNQEQSAWFVTKALVSSGVAMSIAGSSRPASGGEHNSPMLLISWLLEKLFMARVAGLGLSFPCIFMEGTGEVSGVR